MPPSPLALLQKLDPTLPWRVRVEPRRRGGRTWRLYYGSEPSPWLVIREP
jgi:hypothetical protein